MDKFLSIKHVAWLFSILSIIAACESDKRFPPRGYIPNTPKTTEKLEAAYFWEPQNKINSSYWKDADFVEVSLSDIETHQLYDDGYLNMTGTYRGMLDFNKGADPKVKIKAGYDNTFLYILIEWKDTTSNPSYKTWLWNGPADKVKNDTTTGWTSQRNNDNFSLLFDLDNSDIKDVWKWSLAYTAPFDMALNLETDNQGTIIPIIPQTIARNAADESPRSGPMYEWNGERQEVILPDSTVKLLDPSYYLLDSKKQVLTGDIGAGQVIYNQTADCRYCHGENGNGIPDGFTNGGTLADVFTNKYSREGLIEFIGSSSHEGGGGQYFGKIENDSVKVENLITFLRGIAGIPGNLLIKPASNPEIKAILNISLGGIEKRNSAYKVLLQRKLISDNPNDISFFPGTSYTFSVRFSDNDEINYVGANAIELTFKSNDL